MADWKREEEVHRERARSILGGEPRLFEAGSVPVFVLGERVLKLMPPEDSEFIAREIEALELLEGRLSLPTPRLLSVRSVKGWTAIEMSRLPGRGLREAWPGLSVSTRLGLMRALGRGLRELHSLPVEGLAALSMDGHAGGWSGFVSGQLSTAAERQREWGLEERWLEQIPGFLESLDLSDGRRVLLHTEVMREHLLVEGGRLSGLIDFEPAMVGAPEYELASVGLFVSEGEPGMWAALLEGYGLSAGPELARRVMGWALLHRYSNLRWYLGRLPGGSSLEELAERWFG